MSESLPAYDPIPPTLSASQAPPRALSIVHDWREIAEATFTPVSNPEDTELDMQCHHWMIDHWDSVPELALGTPFTVGGQRWNLVLYPNGTVSSEETCKDISVYLAWNRKSSDSHASAHVQFIITLSNHKYPTNHVSRYARYRFDSQDGEDDWGFTYIAPDSTIRSRDNQTNRPALLQDGKLRISAIVRVLKDDIQQQNEKCASRRRVGFVPIRDFSVDEDDGHCNVILQLLFNTNFFRRAIFRSEATDCAGPLAVLQKVFYSLQYSSTCVESQRIYAHDTLFSNSTDLIECKSTLQRKLLEEKPELKEHYNAIFGIEYSDNSNIDYSITLDPTCSDNLEESLSSYVSNNELLFHTLPPVLHIQLRSSIDDEKDRDNENRTWKAAVSKTWKSITGISDKETKFNYPATIDLSSYTDEASNRSGYEYTLHSVIARSTSTKKYHIFVRPFPTTNKWYKFNSKNVVHVEESEVIRGYNGAFSGASHNDRSVCTPYLLSYVKTSKLYDMLIDVPRNDIPSSIAQWVYQLWKEDHILANNRIAIVVFTDDSLRASKKMDLFDEECVVATEYTFAWGSDTVDYLYESISEQYLIPKTSFRLWIIRDRENGAQRPYEPLEESDCSAPLENVFSKDYNLNVVPGRYYQLYLEEHSGVRKSRSNILIFIKYFDIRQTTIRGLGHLIVNLKDKIESITGTVNAMAGQPSDTKLELYEVRNPITLFRPETATD
ncbi:ICP0-binding domain of ubiquitin-specific protease 7-domain-containing protein, partial [Fennellomyces sp. T-0311]